MSDEGTSRGTGGLDLETAAKLGNLFHGLALNPKSRRIVAKALKEVAPDSPEARSFSDVEMEDRFEAFKRDQEEKELKRQQDEIVERMNGQRKQLLDRYSEDEVKKIEALMEKKGMLDYEDGAVLYAATLPPDDPKPGRDIPEPHGTTWKIPEFEAYSKDPERTARERANQVVSELMRKRR